MKAPRRRHRGRLSRDHPVGVHGVKDVLDDIFLALGVENVVAREDVAAEKAVFAGKRAVDGIGGAVERNGEVFDAENCEFKFAGVVDG